MYATKQGWNWRGGWGGWTPLAQVGNPPSSSKKKTFWRGRRAGTPLAQGANPPSSFFLCFFCGKNFDLCFFVYFLCFFWENSRVGVRKRYLFGIENWDKGWESEGYRRGGSIVRREKFRFAPPPPGREFSSDGKSRQGSTPLAKICQLQHCYQVVNRQLTKHECMHPKI